MSNSFYFNLRRCSVLKCDLIYPIKCYSWGPRGSNFLSEDISETHWPNGDIYQVWSKMDENCRRSSLLRSMFPFSYYGWIFFKISHISYCHVYIWYPKYLCRQCLLFHFWDKNNDLFGISDFVTRGHFSTGVKKSPVTGIV